MVVDKIERYDGGVEVDVRRDCRTTAFVVGGRRIRSSNTVFVLSGVHGAHGGVKE
jgi:hypothetical protein